MARINTRPDTVYVKELTEEDKDRFEKLLKHLNTTNNGQAVLTVIEKYFILLEKNKEQKEEIQSLQNTVKTKDKKLSVLSSKKSEIENQLCAVENTIQQAKEFINNI